MNRPVRRQEKAQQAAVVSGPFLDPFHARPVEVEDEVDEDFDRQNAHHGQHRIGERVVEIVPEPEYAPRACDATVTAANSVFSIMKLAAARNGRHSTCRDMPAAYLANRKKTNVTADEDAHHARPYPVPTLSTSLHDDVEEQRQRDDGRQPQADDQGEDRRDVLVQNPQPVPGGERLNLVLFEQPAARAAGGPFRLQPLPFRLFLFRQPDLAQPHQGDRPRPGR